MIRTVLFTYLCTYAVISTDVPDDEECASGNGAGQAKGGSALLQARRVKAAVKHVATENASAAQAPAGTDVSATGAGAPLTETGYMILAAQCCNYEMQEYIRRVVQNEGMQVCNEGGLIGITPYYSCQAGPQTLAKLKEDLHINVAWKCPWVDYTSGDCALAHNIDPNVCPPEPPEHPDMDCGCVRTDSVNIDFFGATVTHSNLNGVGPDSGSQDIRYTNVGTYNGQILDLIVSADANYRKSISNPNATNGKNGKFGAINVLGGVRSEFTFTIVNTGTNTPVELNEVHFSLFDLDQSFVGKMKERVYVPAGYKAFVVNKDVEFDITRTADGSTAFMSTLYGVGCDNPSDPVALGSKTCNRKDGTVTIDQRKRSFMLVYRTTSSWKFTVEITCDSVVTGDEDDCVSGRNLLFAGTSSLRDRCEE